MKRFYIELKGRHGEEKRLNDLMYVLRDVLEEKQKKSGGFWSRFRRLRVKTPPRW